MQRRMVVTLAVLALLVAGVTGCKKKEEQTAPQTTTPAETGSTAATAPGATATTPGSAAVPEPSATGMTGEGLYKQHCAACHPNGGNTIKPDKPLGKKALAKHKITKSEDIVKVMRNPGPGMNKFDQGMLSDDDAKKIGDYILLTFP